MIFQSAQFVTLLFVAFAIQDAFSLFDKFRRRKTQSVCPREFDISGDKCFQQKFAEPEMFCPDGGELSGMDCVQVGEMTMSCPIDSFLNEEGDACVHEIRAQKIPFCQNGFDMVRREGRQLCQTVAEAPIEPYCGDDCLMEGRSCWEQVGVPTYDCDEGETFVDNHCVREINDCENDHQEYRNQEYRNQEYRNQEYRNLMGMGNLGMGKMGMGNLGMGKMGMGNLGMGKMSCRRTFRREARAVCKKGKHMRRSCVDTAPQPLQFRCPGVVQGTSQCNHVRTEAVSYSCPYDFEEVCPFKQACYCAALEETALVPVCDGGYEDDGRGGCVSFCPAEMNCPPGYNLDGVQCVQTCYSETRVTYVPQVETCTTCQ